MSEPNRVETFALSYESLDLQLGAIGGMRGLLTMLPAMLPGIEEAMLVRIEEGMAAGEPVDLRVDLPGLTYIVNLRDPRDGR